MNEPLIYIPQTTPTIEEMMGLSLDGDTPDEDFAAIMEFNDVTCQWFEGEVSTNDYLNLVDDVMLGGVNSHLDRLDRILRSV